jgi:hypothetical protein
MAKSACGLVLVKKFTYRGDPEEEWSNKYWLTGADPGNSTAWKELADALIGSETACYISDSKVVRAYGYNDPGDEVPGHTPPASVWSYDYELATEEVFGKLPADPAGQVFAGDQAATLAWRVDRRSTKGKPIFLRKYFHSGHVQLANPDKVAVNTKAEYENFGTFLSSGAGVLGRHITDALNTDIVLAVIGSEFVTTRTLKRRGKRP